jgi:hypothetical protein
MVLAVWEDIKRTHVHLCSHVRIQLPLGLKRKISFTHFRISFRENTKILAKVSLRKLTKITETLMTTWGMRLKVENCLLK